MPEEFLHRADVLAGLKQVGGEAVPQRVAADRFCDVRLARLIPDGALEDRLVQVESAPCSTPASLQKTRKRFTQKTYDSSVRIE